MPIYDYECSGCGHRFELKQGFDAQSEGECPLCHGAARRRIHSVTVIYKGSGWYNTDYKHSSISASSDSSNGKEPAKKSDGEPAKGEPAKKDEKAAPATTSEKKD